MSVESASKKNFETAIGRLKERASLSSILHDETDSPMTKSELVEAIFNKSNLSRDKAKQTVNCIFDSMIDALKQDGRVEIRGFGSFSMRSYKAMKAATLALALRYTSSPRNYHSSRLAKTFRGASMGTNDAISEGPAFPKQLFNRLNSDIQRV